MPAKIHVERMMYRSSVVVSGESAASYALVKLIPSGEGAGKPLGLNLALVLDVSGSMYEEDGTGTSRLARIQQAARAAVQKLKPDDTLAVVAFAHDAQVILPSTSLTDKERIEEVLGRIDRFEVDPGGTSMDQGISLGLGEIEKNRGAGRLSQVVVLTDGETSGEHMCRQLAQQAAQKKVHFTVMGVGTEWNASLLKDLARLAEGKWYYIDVNQADDAQRVFVEEFEHLTGAGFTNVEMALRPFKDVKIKRVRQVVPDIRELKTLDGEGQSLVVSLGTLDRDKSSRYILDLSLPKRPEGKYAIAKIEVTYDVAAGKRETTGEVPLEVQYGAQQGYVNAEVARHIDEVQLFEQNQLLQQAIATNDKDEAVRVAKAMEQKGQLLGPRAAKKTMLARQVLQEINVGGRVSKKTQLAVDDAARLAEEMPTS